VARWWPFAHFALAAGSAALTLGLVEAGLRALLPQDLHRDEGLYTADARRAFRLTPGFRGFEVSSEFRVPIAINAHGLREREVDRAKSPGLRRILVLGDSFTYGGGVTAEATYPRRLEDLLRHHRCGPFEVLNAGVSGYGTFHQAAFLRDEGWTWEPDLLILQLFPDNDVAENLEPFRLEVRGGVLRFRSEASSGRLDALKEWVRHRSHAYRFLGDRYHVARVRFGLEPFYAASIGVYARFPSPGLVEGWAETRSHIGAIVQAARARDVGFLAIHAPKGAALDDVLWRRLVAFHQADPDALDRARPGRILAAIFQEAGAPFLDLAPLLRASGRPLDFYYPRNGHWNARGHDRVAHWIVEALERERLLEPARRAREAVARARSRLRAGCG
jgi:hypothetical protein